MKINFKARLRNKTFLISICALVISFVYHVLALLGITPKTGENEIIELLGIVINILAVTGVVVDPTTKGVADSDRAMTYCTDCDIRINEEGNNE